MRKKEEVVRQKLARLRSAPGYSVVRGSLETPKLKGIPKTVYKRERDRPEPTLRGVSLVLEDLEAAECCSPARVRPPVKPFVQRTRKQPVPEKETTPKKEKSRGGQLVSDVLFFAVLLGVVLGLGAYKQMNQQSGGLFGYYFYTVLSGSMEREIPKGSLVVVKATPADQLAIDDNITFFRDADTVVTHRIVSVIDDYEGSGGRGFVTKGLENPMPDAKPVHEINVVGRVIRHFPGMGFAVSLIGANLKWVVLLLALAVILGKSLGILISERKARKKTVVSSL